MKMHARIERAIKRKKTTQKAVCAHFGWQLNRISKVKRNESWFTVEEIRELAAHLGVRPAWLVDDDVPDDPDSLGLPLDEAQVLGAFRKAKSVLSAVEVIYLIGEAKGRKNGETPAMPADGYPSKVTPVLPTNPSKKIEPA